MTDTGKLKPEFTARGVFVPWAGVLTGLGLLLTAVLIPLWLLTAKASLVADRVETNYETNQRQDTTLTKHGEDIAALKARKTP